MNRLWVRLSLAFAIVIAVSIGLALVLMNRQVSTGFQRYLVHSQVAPEVVDSLASLYDGQGSWEGVEQAFEALASPAGGGQGRRRGVSRFVLADADGQVIYDAGGQFSGGRLSTQQLATSLPIQAREQTVGYLYAVAPGQAGLASQEQAFLDQVSRSLLQAGMIGGLLGILLSLAIAGGLSLPLQRLARAARRISQGDLEERVPETGSQEVAEVAQAFNEMAADLQESEVLRRNMVADIAHELRTPLTVIQGNLQAILDGVYPLERQEISAIYGETVVLNRLIVDLRELSQVDAGQLQLHLGVLEIGPLVESSCKLFEELASDRQISLQADVAAGLSPVRADGERLRQVLNNLIGNALRYTPAGGVIQVRARPARTAGLAGGVRVVVADTGPGIPADRLPHVFERFWRADPSRSREQGGSGLGLAIAKKLIEAHGGVIGVDSVVGQGSRFWFELPAYVRPPQDPIAT